jgi:uncharacterized protein YicC (UPF0701 family)
MLRAAAAALKRGNIGSIHGDGRRQEKPSPSIARPSIASCRRPGVHARIGGEAPRADALLACGVLEVPAETDEAEIEHAIGPCRLSGQRSSPRCGAPRRGRGFKPFSPTRSAASSLSRAARDCPARSAEAVKARLAEQVSRLMETGASFDRDRLHQEAVLVATRADIRRTGPLFSRRAGCGGSPMPSPQIVPRQEFNREANTLCSKAIDMTLTQIGLELKSVIDQLREQVQNIE